VALTAGTRLGPYEILSALGAGCMGEVYRARDTKLGRDVAIKVLPESLAGDPERLARFSREAHVLATLNHPNIAHIHGFEDSTGVPALVMELVEGRTLADRIAQGAIPLDEALPIAKQIADALEAAHEQGIIHRDLKPANIKVRDDGTVKVLDFGLAKALDPMVPSSPNVTNSPTLSVQATQAGIILGTAAYMAPEQAHGRAADRRADIFSFGAVLFEILTGKQAFTGESVSDTLASILKVDPDWSQLPAETPHAIVTLLRRCVIKDRTQRLQAMGEARIVLAQPVVEEPAQTAGTRRSSSILWVFTTALATIVAVVAIWGWLRPRSPERRPVLRFANELSVANVAGALALSRDGSRLAFVAGPRRQIYIRSMDQLAAAAIPNTENAGHLCFSPDGQWISYIVGDPQSEGTRLMKIAVAGGPAQKLADAPSRIGPPTQSWGADGNILFDADGALSRISSDGGQLQTLAAPDAKSNERFFSGPQLLPGGNDVLASVYVGPSVNSHRIVAFNLQTHQKKLLLEQVGMTQYVPSEPGSFYGYLVSYDATSGSLFAVPFDVNRLEIKGAPVPLIDGVRGSIGSFGTFSISDSGTLAYAPGSSLFSTARTIVWVDRQGVEQPTAAPMHQYNLPRLSPDGGQVAVEIQDAGRRGTDIWVYDLVRNILSPITFEGTNISPVWTPAGKRLIYASGTNLSSTVLVTAPADRSGPSSAITNETRQLLPTSVSPDGETVIGVPNLPATAGNEIFVVPLSTHSATAKSRTFLASRFRKSSVVFSPNGQWVAYASTDSGRSEVYVTAYPGPGATTPISSQGGTLPRWGLDGRELFYRNGTKMMAVDVQLVPTFRAGRSTVLFEGSYGNGYDVAPDGKRFLMIKNAAPVHPPQPDQLNIVVNWVQELKARVPAR